MEQTSNPKLYKIRHSWLIFYLSCPEKTPSCQTWFWPPTDTGFYYDFDFGDTQISENDFKEIEK